jgi:hypothetical protein
MRMADFGSRSSYLREPFSNCAGGFFVLWERSQLQIRVVSILIVLKEREDTSSFKEKYYGMYLCEGHWFFS